ANRLAHALIRETSSSFPNQETLRKLQIGALSPCLMYHIRLLTRPLQFSDVIFFPSSFTQSKPDSFRDATFLTISLFFGRAWNGLASPINL
ncbi:hypothetical protein KI387_025551, partial [Taxus chinensis]